jgi:HSP20 family molecular chaperone IbpA
MTNVVPDGGEFAAQGKIQALDDGASTLTLVPASALQSRWPWLLASTLRTSPWAMLRALLVPAADIFETGEALTVVLEMPGVEKKM